MKKIIACLLCLTMLAGVFASCSKSDDDKGAIISMYLAQYPQTLDPALVQLNSDVTQVLGLIFESLTTIDKDGKVQPALADEWYSSYDPRDDEYKMFFKLKKTQWSDKRAVSADDVIYAWKRILSPETESPYASMLYPIKNAKSVKAGIMTTDDLGLAAANDDLLEVTFEKEYDINLFAETVSNIHLCPVREDIVVRAQKEEVSGDVSAEDALKVKDWAANAASIVCNGPFRIQAQDEGIKLVLQRNEYYMRDVKDDALDKYVLPYRIVCLYQEYESTKTDSPVSQLDYQTQRFKEEKIFYLGGFTKSTFDEYKKDIETSQTLDSYVYYYNTKNEILSDAKVRQALSVALDRNRIVSEITGTGEVAATGYVPTGVFNTKGGGDDFRTAGGNLYNTSGDVGKAKQLLSEAGVSGGSFTLTYLIPQSKSLIDEYKNKVAFTNVYQDVAEYAKSVWSELGFDVTLQGLNPADYMSALTNRTYDVLGINNIMDSVDAFAYLAPFSKLYSGSKVSVDFESAAYTLHYTNIDSTEYDSLIDSIVYVSDRTERAKLLHQAETMLNDLCPATALYFYTNSYVASSDLKNIDVSYFGYKLLNDLKLKNYEEINSIENAASNPSTAQSE